MEQALRPLGGHAVFLLLVQMAVLLTVARFGAEAAKRVGLPAVVGELAAGILLGPTVFGHYAPGAFAAMFPHETAQFNLLEVVGTLGLVLLLLLTGLETDLRLLKNLGRAALIASATGMALPFATGFVLGTVMPASYLAQPDHRILFSLFLATGMSISAMPVIAKILMDLDLTKRNIGLVILSAGVVDDTAGWLILSLIAGAASSGTVHVGGILTTILYTALFLAGAGLILWPLLRISMGVAGRYFKTHDADLVLILVATFLCAALTDKIGIHAVFGAFICGTVLRQVPRVSKETIHRLESFVFAILSPIFFGIVGLEVDLWSLRGGGGKMFAVVLTVACVGKLVGCSLGGIWGGMRFWEASAIAIAMNARGAMGLVLATVGLSLGILNQQMFSIIVMVAIVTSFMAPLGLRLIMPLVRMTDEEAKRIAAEESKGVFDPARVRILVPTAGGPNAVGAARLAFGLAKRSENEIALLYIDALSSWWQRVKRWFARRRGRAQAGEGLDEHLQTIKALADGARPPNIRQVASRDVAASIVEEAEKGYDMILVGASQRGPTLGGPVLEDVIESAPCHVAIIREAAPLPQYKSLIVPIDGSLVSRVAAEFAVRYAEVTNAQLTLAVSVEHRPQVAAYAAYDDYASAVVSEAPPETDTEKELARISTVFKASSIKPSVLRLAYDPSSSALAQEAANGKYDLVVLGAENRAVQHRLFFGYDTERLIRMSPVAVVIVVPHLPGLRA
jgi:Kef-type K+ transport system membrane component KefB/nucleotide-binding universal stress UspA family protein